MDTLSQKIESIGSMAYFGVSRYSLAWEVHTLAEKFMRLQLTEGWKLVDNIEERSAFIDQIKSRQFEEENLARIHDKLFQVEAKKAIIDDKGLLRIIG